MLFEQMLNSIPAHGEMARWKMVRTFRTRWVNVLILLYSREDDSHVLNVAGVVRLLCSEHSGRRGCLTPSPLKPASP